MGAVIVSLTGLVKGKSGQRVHLEQRVATRVVVRVGGKLVPKLAIDDLHAVYSGVINPLGSGSVTVTYVVRNTGNVILGGSQQVSTHGLFGTTTKAPRVPTVPALLPGGSFHVRVHVPDVFPELRMSANVRIAPEGLQGELDPDSARRRKRRFLGHPMGADRHHYFSADRPDSCRAPSTTIAQGESSAGRSAIRRDSIP